MKHFKQRFSILTLLIFTTISYSQWAAESAMPIEQISFRPQLETEGLIIGSITFTKEKAKFNSYFFNISAISDDKKFVRRNSGEFYISPDLVFNSKHKGQSADRLTYTFIIKKKPGQYVINQLRLSSVGYMTTRDSFITGFKIPFEVKKGEITYIGNIGLNEYAESNEKVLTLNNTFERDTNLLFLYQPYVLWKTATNESNRQIISK